MTQPRHYLGKALLALMLWLGGGVAAASADPGIAFRNDLPTPVLVQGASLVNGMIRRGQPLLVLPGRTAYDANLPPGSRQVTVLDANQPSRLLLRETVLFTGRDQLYSIRPNTVGPVPPAVLEPQ